MSISKTLPHGRSKNASPQNQGRGHEKGERTREEEGAAMSVQIEKEAPDFEAEAYDQGRVRKIRLSDYRGRWVLLFFYPADFSIV